MLMVIVIPLIWRLHTVFSKLLTILYSLFEAFLKDFNDYLFLLHIPFNSILTYPQKLLKNTENDPQHPFT